MTDQALPRHHRPSDTLLGWEAFDLRGQAARLGLPTGWLRPRCPGEQEPPPLDCRGIPASP
ncbi:hypothetical protein ACWEOE_38605 [Amycolatopsis sp. NPDC004368]